MSTPEPAMREAYCPLCKAHVKPLGEVIPGEVKLYQHFIDSHNVEHLARFLVQKIVKKHETADKVDKVIHECEDIYRDVVWSI